MNPLRATRTSSLQLCGALLLLLPSMAGALEETPLWSLASRENVERTVTGEPLPLRKFWRALAEETLLNALGVVQYFIRIDVNIGDWKYQPTPEGFGQKIADGWEWDPNTFRTNTGYHAYSGALYYQVGRSNGFGPVGSAAWTFGGALMWEYIGEFREQVSANDMIVTGLAGTLVGEALRQGSIAIEQSAPRNIFTTFFVYLLDPIRKVNEHMDGTFPHNRYRIRLNFLGLSHPMLDATAHVTRRDWGP